MLPGCILVHEARSVDLAKRICAPPGHRAHLGTLDGATMKWVEAALFR